MFKTKLSLIDYVILSVIAFGIVAATILAMGKYRPEPRFGKFDVSNIVQDRQKELATRVKGNMTEQEKQQLFDDAKNFGPMLDVAIKAASEECKCALFNSAAMLTAPQGSHIVDMTPRIKEILNQRPAATPAAPAAPAAPAGK